MQKEDLKILVVEDDPIIAMDIKSLLRSEGFHLVGHAKDALRAYDMLQSRQPNFVVLDIHLGNGPSGIDVAEVIHDKYHIPYIFLTSFSDPITLEAAQEQGPYGYLVKPFQEKTLLTTISIAWSNFQRMNNTSKDDTPEIDVKLTEKEEVIFKELLKGSSYKQICQDIDMKMNTLKYHIKNIYSKFDVNGRAELIAMFVK